jgi:hypothetical protein
LGSRRDLSWNPGLSMHFQDAGHEPLKRRNGTIAIDWRKQAGALERAILQACHVHDGSTLG